MFSFTGGVTPLLPVDPSLETHDKTELPKLTDFNLEDVVPSKPPSVVVAEGIPPIPTKLLDKIRKWEFVDLALLLDESSHRKDEVPFSHDGRIILIQSVEQAQKRRKQIVDIHAWTEAFAVYMAALASHSATTPDEVVGLIGHLHLITRLSKDLGGSRWLRYDTDYREWAAAKGVRRWGELNLTIYGRCLSFQLHVPALPAGPSTPMSQKAREGKRAGEKKAKAPRYSPRSGACFKWNFEGSCDRIDCHYLHSCYHCGEYHRAPDCPRPPKRPKGEGEN